MTNYKEELEEIANGLLDQQADLESNNKPNYSNRDFFNALIIFQTAIMDKLYDMQESDGMGLVDRLNMAKACGEELKELIHTYTRLDTHNTESLL